MEIIIALFVLLLILPPILALIVRIIGIENERTSDQRRMNR